MSNVKLYQSGAVIHQQGHIKLHFLTGAVMDQGTFSPTKLVPFPANLNPQGRIMPPSLAERYRGALLGLACGDAVGTTVEFKPRGSFQPLTDMVGGGPFHLKPGQWTDDTSMALCLAESLLNKNGFNAADQMGRYLN
jgi:hypothetical protein